MLPLDARVADIIAIAGAGVALLALIVAVVAVAKLRGVRRSLDVLTIDGDQLPVIDVLGAQRGELADMRADVERLRGQVTSVRTDVRDALRHVAVVRYDAFADMGGRLSFSVALLDDGGDGVVLSSLIGHRTEARFYAKGVKGGASEQALSPEEQQAIDYAIGGAASRGGRGRVPAERQPH